MQRVLSDAGKFRNIFPAGGGIDTGEAKTALQAGHTESVLFQHYRKMVRREDAEKFWGIFPAK